MSIVANAKNNKMPLWITVLSEANQANPDLKFISSWDVVLIQIYSWVLS